MKQSTVIWLIILRVVVITTLLVAGFLFQFITEFTYAFTPFFYLTALTYLLTILYIILLKFARATVNITLQLFGDILIVTAVVYLSGGIESSFSFLYLIVIITASILLYRRGGITLAASSGIAYGAMVDLQYYGFLTLYSSETPGPTWSPGKIYYNLFINIIGFFIAAFLTSVISEKLRSTTEVLSATTSHLHDLQVFQHSVLTSIASPLVITDPRGEIQYSNPAAREIFQEMNGTASHPIERLVLSASETGKEFKKAITWKESVYVPSISPFSSSDGTLKGFILIFDDITQLQNLEEELREKEHIAAIGIMAASIAHEIRNPLASITGAVQMMEEDSRGESRRLYTIIKEESRRLNRFIEAFIHFVRSPEPNPTIIDIVSQMTDFLHLIRSDPAWASVNVRFEPPPNPLLIRMDRDHLQQILWNLFSNALKALGEKGGNVDLSLARDDKWVVLRIKDSGSGFGKEGAETLFEPFRGAFTRGLGLGLTMVKRYVEENGGTIKAHNAPDGGAEFILHLPGEDATK